MPTSARTNGADEVITQYCALCPDNRPGVGTSPRTTGAFTRPPDLKHAWARGYPPPRIPIPLASLACTGLALLALLRRRRGAPAHVAAAALGVLAVVAWPYARVHASNPLASSVAVSEEQAGEVVGGLLRNVYHAFDFRVEEQIYDTLAKSTSGELLTDVYLETRKALELENQGGARARVQEVEIVATDTRRLDGGGGFETRCTWNVTGAVGHWGHIHQRRNQYEAELTIESVDGRWTITDLELLSEARL